MKKAPSIPERLASLFGLLLIATMALASYATFSLFVVKQTNNGAYTGTIGLRSYFQRGVGTASDPFVIARPYHYYNLSRLQNLGVFSSKYYFSLGYDVPEDDQDAAAIAAGTNHDLKFYDKDGNVKNYLDMTGSSEVLTVGNEASPFYGEFNGNGKEIYNLVVRSGPEDVGVFGYTYSGSLVQNVYLNNPTIIDNGYDNGVTGLATLYGDTSTQIALGSMSYLDDTLTTQEVGATPVNVGTYTKTLTVHLPDNSSAVSGLSYQVRSSSEYFDTVVSGSEVSFTARTGTDTTDKSLIANNTDFTSASGTALSSRISIVGSLYQNGIFYSKILKTYKVTFHNTITDNVGTISLSAALDYVNTVASGESGYVSGASEYAHGINIGYLVGHCDGSIKSCYVFGGSLSLNNAATGIVAKPQESETGLVGEVGPALSNVFTPEVSYANSGDTGVVNFTRLFTDIIGSSIIEASPDVGNNTFTYHSIGGNTFYSFTPAAGTSADYLKYLRNTHESGSGFYYVTNANRSISFAGRSIIRDEKTSLGDAATVNRNLGVFSLAAGASDNSAASNFAIDLSDFTVVKRSSAFTTFYYTTAEFDDPSGTSTPYQSGSDFWGYSSSDWDRSLLQCYRLPAYADDYTWNSRLERRFNYIFECALSASSASNYFYNTTSKFLQKYFEYKLVDKLGNHLAFGTGSNKDFGVFVKDSDLAKGTTSSIGSFDSYLALASVGNSAFTTLTDAVTGETSPVKSVDFSIKSETGANVTIIAGSPSGSGGYVSIYDKAFTLASARNTTSFRPARHPAYTMYLPYTNSMNSFAYFPYDYSTGATSSAATWAVQGERLFAHTFFVPKGDYFVSSPQGSIYLYYVAAQGQEGSGNIGNETKTFSSVNTIENVDFISKSAAQDSAFNLDLDRCYLSFAATFSSQSGSLSVTSSRTNDENATTISRPGNLQTLLVLNSSAYPVTFNGTTYRTKFITYPSS